jgi:hypothetical protein
MNEAERKEAEREQIFATREYIEEKERWIEGHLKHIEKLREDIDFAGAKGVPPENGPDKDGYYDDEYFMKLRKLAEEAKDTAPWFVWTYGGDISSKPLDCILFNTTFHRTTEQGFHRATEKGMTLCRYVAAADPRAILWLMDEIGSISRHNEALEEQNGILDARLLALGE